MTHVPDSRHPALDAEQRDRVDYLCVVASMAFADNQVDDAELACVRDLCGQLQLSDADTSRVVDAARAPDRVAIDAILGRLRQSSLRFALMVDAIEVAFADEQLVPAEALEIVALSERLGLTDPQVRLIERYVSDRRTATTVDSVRELAAGLAAAGVPVSALAMANGSRGDNPSSVAASLGVGRYGSVKWLYRRATAPTVYS